ncbi:MAG: nucleotide exchange factor GrpE [Actinobacteria bacterium]|nr:nucleotide exchange factor GrpE [Actinomycetota bacterium]MSW76833.1 nucleotide exchange factor GrpE [Actinomycetota bacterium]MSX53907.1 nucleotide exchange factor GrpE [Actinomycetota bacterium]MSX92285.1 nucleotide exchange factor GrpE [Actinomycetota bacterium]MSZ83423.1 nucleotide exchange factor GrpE [Actinomycetota bacterium]
MTTSSTPKSSTPTPTTRAERMSDQAEPDDLDPQTVADIDAALAGVDTSEVDAAEAAIEHDVDALLAERDSFKDIALRLQADFDNYRKRVANQQADEVQRATGKLAEALLPVLDACEAAYVQHPAEVEPIFNLILGSLKKMGLEAMNLHDQPFDPNLAEAVMHEPGDEGDPIVSEVLRSGYTWHGKVLRAAMVKVRG